MIRIFLRLYGLLLLPIIIFALLPQNPLVSYGQHLSEQKHNKEYGSLYHLINLELESLPESQWQEKIKTIAPYFGYDLKLSKIEELKFKDDEKERLLKQGFIVQWDYVYKMLYRIKASPWIVEVFLDDEVTDLEKLEKQTRGIRYLVNKQLDQGEDETEAFEKLKPFFDIPIVIKKLQTFPEESEIRISLNKTGIHLDKKDSDKTMLYFLSKSKQNVAIAGPLDNGGSLRTLYKYASLAIPGLLVALGGIIWLFILVGELKKMNYAAKQMGRGKLDTRVELSRFSALHPLSEAYNHMAGRIQGLINGQRDLTNAVSHELKTPLSRIRFALEMQKEATESRERDQYTQKIESNIVELETLIDELLSYSRMEREQSSSSHKNQHTHHLKNWLTQELHHFTEYHPKITLQQDIASNTQQDIVLDKIMMARALNNLLNNAARYTHSIVRVSATLENGITTLTVEDNGNGINKEDQERIFQPFIRVDESRQRSSNDHGVNGGYGLGLSIVKRIMESQGGGLKYQPSNLGGAGFVMWW